MSSVARSQQSVSSMFIISIIRIIVYKFYSGNVVVCKVERTHRLRVNQINDSVLYGERVTILGTVSKLLL